MTGTAAPPIGGANTPETRQNRSTPRATTRRTIQIADYQPHPRNYNRHPADQLKRIGHSLETFGQVRSIVVWRQYFLAGHGVAEAARLIGWSTLEADELPDDYPEAKALAYVAADNELSRLADPDAAQLAAILQESREADPALMAAIGYTDAELADLLARIGAAGNDTAEQARQTLAERFLIPPFSVLDARQGYWQDRKRAWIALGIQSELGRGDGVTWGDSAEITEPGLNYYRNRNAPPRKDTAARSAWI